VNLDNAKTSTALRYLCTHLQVHTYALIAFLLLIDIFGEAMGLKGQEKDEEKNKTCRIGTRS
jgi:hypothetical protein